MRQLFYGVQFKKDFKRMKKRGLPVSELQTVVDLLLQEEALPAKYRDHSLRGEWAGMRECHIRPDWLLIYRASEDTLILTLIQTGSHADLFDL